MTKFISVIYGDSLLQDRRFCMSSSVNSSWFSMNWGIFISVIGGMALLLSVNW